MVRLALTKHTNSQKPGKFTHTHTRTVLVWCERGPYKRLPILEQASKRKLESNEKSNSLTIDSIVVVSPIWATSWFLLNWIEDKFKFQFELDLDSDIDWIESNSNVVSCLFFAVPPSYSILFSSLFLFLSSILSEHNEKKNEEEK